MAIHQTQGILLRTRPFRSSSLIVTLYTKNFGKIRGLAKGVRAERELRGSLYELFTHLDIVFYEKTRTDLHLISEAAILDSYEAFRGRLDAICYASYFAELVDVLTEVHDPHEEIYHLLDFHLTYLSSLPGAKLARLFEIRLLREVGWLPDFSACFQCHKQSMEEGSFSLGNSALYCHACSAAQSNAFTLKAETLGAIRYYLDHDLYESIRLGLSQGVASQLSDLMEALLLRRLDYPLKTRLFMAKIGQPA